jgi:undecaprenyl-diphosphatase
MAGMDVVKIIILALIQGAAELLPVSSSAHVIVAERLMGYDPASPEMTFLLVMLHTGTMFAVLVYFWPRWKPLLRSSAQATTAGGTAVQPLHFVKMIVLATLATGAVGLGLMVLIEKVIFEHLLGHSKGEVEHLFKNLPMIAAALFAVGVLIIASGSRDRASNASPLTAANSTVIGIVQGLCLPFRGFSRSGATISTALNCGIRRSLAEDFSFALAVALTPPVIVRELYRLLKAKDWRGSSELLDLLLPGFLGMVFAFLAGLVALRILSAALEKGRWKYFGYYCLIASFGVLAAARFLPPLE